MVSLEKAYRTENLIECQKAHDFLCSMHKLALNSNDKDDSTMIKRYLGSFGLYLKNFFHVNLNDWNDSDNATFYLLLQLVYICSQIKNCLRFSRNDQNEQYDALVYYTTLKTLNETIKKRKVEADDKIKPYRFPVFDVKYMNDPEEGDVFLLLMGIEENKGLKNFYESELLGKTDSYIFHEDYTFVKSFMKAKTEVGNCNLKENLDMWQLYADGAQGCRVRLDMSTFNRLLDVSNEGIVNDSRSSYSLFEVAYVNDEGNIEGFPRLQEYINKFKELFGKLSETNWTEFYQRTEINFDSVKHIINHCLSEVRYLFKKDHYKNEQEVRLILSKISEDISDDDIADIGRDDFPHFPKLCVFLENEIQIQEVMLGPKVRYYDDCIPFIHSQLEKINKRTGVKFRIVRSRISYR
jgi:hypothetical protein